MRLRVAVPAALVLLLLLFLSSMDAVLAARDPARDDPLLRLHEAARTSPHCGVHWREEFQRLQASIVTGHSPPRFLVHTSSGQGANDRLTGVVTAFLLALLSRRALQLHTHRNVPELLDAFDTPYVDLRVPHDTAAAYQAALRSRNFSSVAAASVHFANYFDAPQPLLAWGNRSAEDASFLFNATELFFYSCNRGATYQLLADSPRSRELKRFQLSPQHGFRCVFHFLFRPNEELLALARPYSAALSIEDVLKIGIQIRTGDDTFRGRGNRSIAASHYYQNFFHCAQHLEDEALRVTPGRRVLWYLISDSLELRREARGKFGDKLLTNTADRALHTGVPRSGRRAMQLLFAEELTLALCDHFIVSHDSAVGRLAAWLSLRGGDASSTVHLEHRDYALQPSEPRCKPPEPIQDIVRRGAGI